MIIKSTFKPAWWLPGPHFQTGYATLARRKVKLMTFDEKIELEDGDYLELSWVSENNSGPIVIVLHGLGGCIESHYAQGMLSVIRDLGWRCVFMHFRGAKNPNRLARTYHSGDTQDVNSVVHYLQSKEPNTPLMAIGYSLGGNVLLKYLGETGENCPLRNAIAVSVPFDLHKTANYVNKGFSRLYQWWLLRAIKQYLEKKFQVVEAPIEINKIHQYNNFLDFDNYVTAPLNGFNNARHYYKNASCRPYFKHIRIPTLIIHASDDPFMPSDVIPGPHELSDAVVLELSDHGGHVGFITGDSPLKPVYWLEQRIPDYLQSHLAGKLHLHGEKFLPVPVRNAG